MSTDPRALLRRGAELGRSGVSRIAAGRRAGTPHPSAAAPANASRRLGLQDGEVLDRTSSLIFTWNGTSYGAFAGDTIISALAAAGERVYSRSFKYHRPRGLLTATYFDPGCTVQLPDEPNVRGAHRRVEPGMTVTAQNVWPSLRYDVAAANQALGTFLGAGFYYKTFIKPQRLWPAYQQVLKRFASGGVVSPERRADRYDKRYAHPDVLVAGGGPAGMSAALAAAEAGASVMLVEQEYELGGHLRYGTREELAVLAELRNAVASQPGIEVLVDSVVTGRYDDNWVAVTQRGLGWVTERLIKARARRLVVAPGLIERPYVFAGNDKPGVMLSTAARRLINLWAVRPGERAVVLTANPSGEAAAADLERAGVQVVRVIDARRGGNLVRARGGREVAEVELPGGARVECDLLVTATGWTAPTSLLNQAGDRPMYDARAARFVPGGDGDPAVLAAGGVVGDGTLQELLDHGRAVGLAAAAGAHGGSAGGGNHGSAPAIPALAPAEHPALFRASTHGIVDFSEDVSSKDLVAAVREGYDHIELAKRYTTATMGMAQGKLELVNAVAVVAEASGRSIAETGTTSWRPPYAPISLGALAGRIHQPVRYSPMQAWHEAHGARPMIAGQWIRPDHYGDPVAEVRAVREAVGLIDVTPLGKLDLRGPDVPKLLNLLYVNKWSKLAVGAVRYGVMCLEDGVVFDDGVTGRLGEAHYLMSTTTSGAAAVWEWAENWLQTEHPDWQVHITPVTTGYASINIAGPRSRELLARVTQGVDLSPDAFGYMQVRTGSIAGVADSLMWRIGFTGELSYEIHVPAGYGLHVWEALFAVGADLGARAFGIEAQRVLRLEKGHLIVSQDTDGLTKAFSAELGWLVKLDKDDFAGLPELVWQHAEGGYDRLVGLQPADPGLVPDEGCQLIEPGSVAHAPTGPGPTIVGRITSSRWSPTLGRSICLGFVSPRLAEPGTMVTIRLPDGRDAAARVTPTVHFDPEGARLRG